MNSSDIPAIRQAWEQADHDKKIKWILKANRGSGSGYYATLNWLKLAILGDWSVLS